jgi:hypothetical protein
MRAAGRRRDLSRFGLPRDAFGSMMITSVGVFVVDIVGPGPRPTRIDISVRH